MSVVGQFTQIIQTASRTHPTSPTKSHDQRYSPHSANMQIHTNCRNEGDTETVKRYSRQQDRKGNSIPAIT